jgi:hypothetical protein
MYFSFKGLAKSGNVLYILFRKPRELTLDVIKLLVFSAGELNFCKHHT